MVRVDQLLDLFGLDRYAENLVSQRSTGWRRLVDLAAVEADQPSVEKFDQPLLGRRPARARGQGRAAAHRAGSARRHLLVVEHDIAFIAELADRLVAMDRGTVLTSGLPRDVLGLSDGRRGLPRLRPPRQSRSGVAAPMPTTTEVDPK